MMHNFVILKGQNVSILTNCYGFHSLAVNLGKLYNATTSILTANLVDDIKDAVEFFKSNEQFIQSFQISTNVKSQIQMLSGTNGYPARISIESLTNLQNCASQIVSDLISMGVANVPFHNFTTIKLENFFSTLRNGTVKNPPYITAIRKLNASIRCCFLKFSTKNRKAIIFGRLFPTNTNRKRRKSSSLMKSDTTALRKAARVIGKSYSTTPMAFHKDAPGYKPSSFYYITKKNKQLGIG